MVRGGGSNLPDGEGRWWVIYLMVRGGGEVESDPRVDCGSGDEMDNNPGGNGLDPTTKKI